MEGPPLGGVQFIDKLIPYANNARTHTEEQVDEIAAAITEFGFTNPILIDADGGVLAGHGRLLAARKLGMTVVPCVELSHLSETQKRAYVLADNRLAEKAGWDLGLVSLELDALVTDGFDIGLTGFDEEFLPGGEGGGLTDPDAAPDVPETPVTVLGDVWVLGKHRLMCGDSTSIDTVEKLMEGQRADMVFTDPPYGIEYQSNMRVKSEKFAVLKGDDGFLDIAPVIAAVSDGWVFVWTSWKVQNTWIDLFSGFGYPTNIIIWHKPGGGMGDLKRAFSTDYEVGLVWHRGAELCGSRIGSVWTVGKDGATTYKHPTQKPVALGIEAIYKTTKRSAVVLDLFGGSGSTLIACEKTNRVCYMMELDPKYCDVIVNRWQDFTGKTATLEGA